MNKTTLAPIWWPLMQSPDVTPGYCAICGRAYPTEKHHLVRRSAGELYQDGKKIRKPVIELCGFGNNLKDPNGRYYCHGKAHNGLLYFRWNGRLEFLDVSETLKRSFEERTGLSFDYQAALESTGWLPVRDAV